MSGSESGLTQAIPEKGGPGAARAIPLMWGRAILLFVGAPLRRCHLPEPGYVPLCVEVWPLVTGLLATGLPFQELRFRDSLLTVFACCSGLVQL
jgi:hypothetical protein